LNKDAILLTDDAAARLAAKSLNIRAYGSIGILLRAIRRKQSSPAGVIKLLEEIPLKTTRFIRKSLLRDIIEEVKGKYNL
jgi:predicted nucleic acid-binding protein